MASFLSKWINKEGADIPVVSREEAMISFLEMRWDNKLAQLFFGKADAPIRSDRFLAYQQQLSALEMDDQVPVTTEVDLLRRYLELYRELAAGDFQYALEEKIEVDHSIPALLLFPLVKNAVHYGYNSMPERPLKIKITSLGNRLSVEVSNRVNHHLVSQADTEVMEQLKKRLQYCCADSYSLFSNSNSATFKVNFQLTIG